MSPCPPFSVPEEWAKMTLGVLCEADGFIQTGPFGSQLHASDYVEAGVPSIMPVNLERRRIREDGIKRVGASDVSRLAKYRVQTGDIVFSRRGDVERHGYVSAHEDGWLCGTGCLMVRLGRDDVLPEYVSFWLEHPEIGAWLRSNAVGSTMPNLNTAIMARLPVAVPRFAEQSAIVRVLSSLDDKMELNREMNRTLEALAQAIFRSWFVDFDPVVAKGEGREAFGMDAETAALFPDRFVDSELGPIPEGWEVARMRSVARLHRSSVRPFDFLGEEFAHYSIPAFDSGGLPVLESGSDIKSAKYALPDRCLLVSKLNPGSPRVWFPRPATSRRAIASTEFLVITPRESATLEFLLCLNRLPDFQAELAALATGTTGSRQRVKPSAFESMRLISPPPPMSSRFSEIVSPMLALAANNLRESQTLASLRDLLLPKLLSGEIRVPEAAEMVEDAA